jgi:plastocyanin
VRRLVALALAGALVATGATAAQGDATNARQSCGKAKRVKHRRGAHCARVRRASAPRAAAEKLSVFDPATPLPGGGSGGTSGGDDAPAPPPIRFVSATARDTPDYSLTLSRPKVNAGSVTIELRNNGEDPHNLVVSPDDGSHTPLASWADTGPGAILRKSVTLPAGRYQLWCSLLDHEARGMTADLVVE